MFTGELPRVRENVPLKNHTTFRIGGPAKYFFVARTSDDIKKAIRVAQKQRIRFFLLSGGSNILISDQGFPGLVIKAKNTAYTIKQQRVWAESGVSVSTIVRETTQRGLGGFEWAGGLPGTIGGAVRGNAGAFGGETKDSVFQVEAIDQEGKRKVFSKRQCQFSYRSSVFKKKGFIVLSATFDLQKRSKAEIQAIAKEHIQYRKERHPLEYPNAGSIFKNCDVRIVPKKFQKEWKEVIKKDPFPVIPTAFVIASAKLQGLRVGDAQISEKHPNYIVNRNNASAKDVLMLIKKVKQKVKNKFSIDLEEEIQFVS